MLANAAPYAAGIDWGGYTGYFARIQAAAIRLLLVVLQFLFAPCTCLSAVSFAFFLPSSCLLLCFFRCFMFVFFLLVVATILSVAALATIIPLCALYSSLLSSLRSSLPSPLPPLASPLPRLPSPLPPAPLPPLPSSCAYLSIVASFVYVAVSALLGTGPHSDRVIGEQC